MGIAHTINRRVLAPLGIQLVRAKPAAPKRGPLIEDADIRDIRRFTPFTLVDDLRQRNLLRAVRFVNRNLVPGDFVECGVYRGGSTMLAKFEHQRAPEGAPERTFHLFDTFAGMANPRPDDVNIGYGFNGMQRHAENQLDTHNAWTFASLDEVQSNFQAMGLLDDRVVFHKGMVEETLRDLSNLPTQIAILRLDTDFYESTKKELEVLYPRLVAGGILIVDDYDSWTGARRAVDEYFPPSFFFATIGGGGVIARKPY